MYCINWFPFVGRVGWVFFWCWGLFWLVTVSFVCSLCLSVLVDCLRTGFGMGCW